MKTIFKITFICLISFTAFCCFGATVYMKDGRTYHGATDIKALDSLFFFTCNGRSYSINKNKISKIVDNDRIIFEPAELTAKRTLNDYHEEVYIFYKNQEEVGQGSWNANGFFELKTGGMPDGEYNQYYDSGSIARDFNVKNNNLNGICRVYYESGIIQREGNFINGKENGISKLFHKDGKVQGTSIFKDGVKNGETKLFYDSGEVKAIMNFKNGEADGPQKTFYPNGQLETIVSIINGERSGPIKAYYESGKLKMEGTFRNGKLDGDVTTYYESGRVKKRKYFVNGRIMESQHK